MPPDKLPLEPAVPRPGAVRACSACAVRALSVCSAMPVDDLAHLEAVRRDVRLEAQETLFYEGDPANYLFNVTEGTIKAFKLLADGRRQITGFLFAGDFIGLALHNRYTYSAEAVTQATLCRFPRRGLEKLLDEYPSFEKRLLQSASNELAAAQDQMLLLGRKTAKERIATFLLSLSERAGRRGEPSEIVALPMSRSDIGDFLGLTVETVSRTFTRLKKLDVIGLEGSHNVAIIDRPALVDLAGFEPEEPIAALAAGF